MKSLDSVIRIGLFRGDDVRTFFGNKEQGVKSALGSSLQHSPDLLIPIIGARSMNCVLENLSKGKFIDLPPFVHYRLIHIRVWMCCLDYKRPFMLGKHKGDSGEKT